MKEPDKKDIYKLFKTLEPDDFQTLYLEANSEAEKYFWHKLLEISMIHYLKTFKDEKSVSNTL